MDNLVKCKEVNKNHPESHQLGNSFKNDFLLLLLPIKIDFIFIGFLLSPLLILNTRLFLLNIR